MVQTTINLADENNTFIDFFKSQRRIRNKDEAINKIIEEYKELKK